MAAMRSSSLQALLLALTILAGYLLMDTRATLWDRDEPRFARATAEMIATGNYLVPTFNGALRPDKPILVYWLMSLPMRLLGPSELACRFFSAIGTALTCWLTFYIGRRLLSPRAGLWAMVILATTLMMLYMGTAATADGVLLPLMVAQMAVFVGFANSRRRRWAQVLLGLTLGGALLAKGPVGGMPLLAQLVTLTWGRRHFPTNWRLRELVLALGLGLGLFLAWALPANAATEGEFFREGIGHHVLSRAARPLEHHGGRFLLYLPYYLPVILIGLFPWSCYLPGTLSACLGGRLGGASFRALFLAWTLPLLIVMTMVATKLPHYILFMWPMLALGVGAVLDAEGLGSSTPRDLRWLRRGTWLLPMLALPAGVTLIAAPRFVEVLTLPRASALCGLTLIAEALAVTWILRRSSLLLQARVLVACTLTFLMFFLAWVMPVVESIKISPPIANMVKERGPILPVIATFDYAEPSLNFYIGTRLDHLGTRESLLTWLAAEDPGLLIISQRALNALKDEGIELNLKLLGRKRGFNYTKGEMMEIHLLER